MQKIVKPLLMSAAAILFSCASAAQLPVKMSEAADELKRKCQDHTEVSVRGEELVVTLKEVSGTGGFDGQFSIDLKKFSGSTFTFMIDVKSDKLSGYRSKVPQTLGKVYFNTASQFIHSGRIGWNTLVFRRLKVPGNGLVKLRIELKNFNGEVSFRDPRIKGDFPKQDSGTKKKKKKDKK